MSGGERRDICTISVYRGCCALIFVRILATIDEDVKPLNPKPLLVNAQMLPHVQGLAAGDDCCAGQDENVPSAAAQVGGFLSTD